MDKEDAAHMYNGILLSHKKNKIVPFAETWIELEAVIQSELSQKEKNCALKRSTHPRVCSSTVCHSQGIEKTHVPINSWLTEKDAV